MKPERFAAATLAALLTVTACAENPVGPPGSSGYEANAVSSDRAGGGPYTFTALDVPGATQTIPSGINAGGRVVGWYIQGGVTRGFVYEDGVFTTNIVYPGTRVRLGRPCTDSCSRLMERSSRRGFPITPTTLHSE
jgi:probable HAF family extracellular repeat protein